MKSKIVLMMISLLVLGCSDNDVTPVVKTTVGFETSALNLHEADDALLVTIILDEPAQKEGVIEVTFSGSASNPDHYIVLPELENGILELAIEPGEEEVMFMIFPVNDDVFTDAKTITLTLQNPSEGFALGHSSTSIAIIDNDEKEAPGNSEPIAVNFTTRSASILESASSGLEIEVTLERAADMQQVIEIAVAPSNGYEFGVDFTTNPMMVDLLIPIVFDAGQTIQRIMFYPTNNNVQEVDAELIFTISNWSEGLKQGEDFDLILVVEDDDESKAETHTIADLKAHFSNHSETWYFPTDYFIEGVVTNVDNVPNDKFIYIQDETAGIMLSFTLDNLLKVGQRVRLNLKNATGQEVNGQKSMLGVEGRLGTLLEENVAVQPIEITIDDLIKGTYSGQLVKLYNVFFPHADNIKKWEGSHLLSDGTAHGQAFVTTYRKAGFNQEILPKGTFTVTGIAGSWNHLHIRSLHDLKF